MNLEQQVAELEKALQTLTEAHHTALEVERAKVRELQNRLAKYEKQWSKMDYTICKLEQDLRKAKGEQ